MKQNTIPEFWYERKEYIDKAIEACTISKSFKQFTPEDFEQTYELSSATLSQIINK